MPEDFVTGFSGVCYQELKEMRNVKTLTLALAVPWLLAACTAPDESDIQPVGADQRVDMAIEGAFSREINQQGNDGLIDLAAAAESFYNSGEQAVSIRLDANASLRLLLYRHNESQPLNGDGSFSAYPPEVLEDRLSYVVVQYLDGNDQVLYSSTTTGAPPHIQPDVLEISHSAGPALMGRLRAVKLYRNTDSLRLAEETDQMTHITVSGTFRTLIE